MLAFIEFADIGWGGIATGIVGFFVVLYALKVMLPTQLFNTTDSLLTKRTVERDDALRERDAARKEVEELQDEARTLRREIIQWSEIRQIDQATIRELKQQQVK
jgi:hypothetical protein